MAVFHGAERLIATVGFGPEDLEALRASSELEEAEVLPRADLEALVATVTEWWHAYVRSALDFLNGERKPARTEEGAMPHQEPLVLLSLRRAVAGDSPLQLITDPPLDVEQQAELSRLLLTEFAVGLIDGLFTHAFHHGGIATVLSRVEAQVPVECIDEEVRAQLVERCIDYYPELIEDTSRFDRAFHHEYLCAVAHVAAGLPNPRAEHWVALSLLLFVFSRTDRVQMPESILLEASVLRRTVGFEEAWNAAHMLLAASKEDLSVDIEAWFDHLGWGDRYQREWEAVPLEVSLGDLVDVEGEELVARLRTLTAGKDADVADALPRMITNLLMRAGRREEAVKLVLAGLDDLADREEWSRLAKMAIDGAALMNEHLDYLATVEIVSRHLDRLLEEGIGCQQHYGVLNEIGNAFRHLHFGAMALQVYDEVGALMEACEETTESDRLVLRRNRAIVLRELGFFDEAISELEAALGEADRDDPDKWVSMLVSLARAYVDAGLPEQALPHAEAAARYRLTTNRIPLRVEALLVLAAARAAARPGVQLPEMTEALELVERLPRLQALVAAATLHHARTATVAERTIARAVAILEEGERSPDPSCPAAVQVTAAVCLGEWELRRGDGQRAREIVADLRTRFGDGLPWHVDYLEARLPETSLAEAWALMQLVLEALDSGVPDQAGVGFAMPYLVDNAVVQEFLLHTLWSALEAGQAQPRDCVAVFEFLNGREMRGLADGDAPDLFERLRNAAGSLRVLFLLLLENEEEVKALWLRPDGECGLTSLTIEAPELGRISTEFAARAATALTATQMESLEDVARPALAALGEAIEAHARAGEHVCVLPSPALLGLPLHAAWGSDGSLLLERHSIGIAPNLSVVCRCLEGSAVGGGAAEGAAAGSCLIATVCKEGDRVDFVEVAEAAAERIEATLGSAPVTSLTGVDCSKQRLLAEIEGCERFVFIGHGAHAPRAHGRGLCVAAEGQLPSAPLPVDAVPDLRRFMIDAGDLEGLSRTPASVASIACSSGRSFAGGGGTRLGLERALFAGGTRTILAPLWDVNAPSALRFLERFHEALGEQPQVDVAEAHRRTCLALAAEYGHLFLWAPFALNGSWRQTEEGAG